MFVTYTHRTTKPLNTEEKKKKRKTCCFRFIHCFVSFCFEIIFKFRFFFLSFSLITNLYVELGWWSLLEFCFHLIVDIHHFYFGFSVLTMRLRLSFFLFLCVFGLFPTSSNWFKSKFHWKHLLCHFYVFFSRIVYWYASVRSHVTLQCKFDAIAFDRLVFLVIRFIVIGFLFFFLLYTFTAIEFFSVNKRIIKSEFKRKELPLSRRPRSVFH